MENRTNTGLMREAVEDELISWIIGLENITSTLKLIQTVIVLLESVMPLLQDVRLTDNQRDIVAMLRDHLRSIEVELQRQAYEVREHILGRYHRALRGWNACEQCWMRDLVDVGDRVPDKSGKGENKCWELSCM